MVKQSAYEKLEQRVKKLEKELAERKHIEEALRENASMLEDILEKAADGICVCNNIPEEPFVRFTHWNPRMKAITGYSMEEINQLGWYQTMYPDSEVQRRAIERMARMRVGDDILAEEWVITTKDGKRRPLSISTSIVKEEDGRVHVLAVMQDITERKQAEEALRENEDKYRQLFELESDAIFLVDNETGQILELNTAASALYGYSRQELLGKKNSDLSAEPEETRKVTETTPVIVDKVVSIPLRFHRKKDGTVFPVEIMGRFFEWRGRSAHIAAIRDITERKRTEEALQRSQQLFSSLFRANPGATILSSLADGKCVDANEAYAKLTGYTREELIGKTTVELNIWISAEERQRVVTELAEKGHLENVELTLRRKSGEFINTIAAGEIITLDGQKYILSFFLDITERHEAEVALRTRTHQLEVVRGVSEEITRELDLDHLLDLILRRAIELAEAEGGVIVLWDENERALFPRLRIGEYWANMPVRPIPLGEGVVGHVAANREGIIINDYRAWSGARPTTLQYTAIGAALGEPLLYRDKLIGAISLAHTAGRGIFTEQHGVFLRLLANQAAIAIENARLYEAVRRELADRKRTEEALRESEERYRQIAKCVPDMIWTMDLSGQFTYANSAIERTHGWTVEEYLKLTFRDVVTPQQAVIDAAMIEEELTKAASPQYDRNTVRTFESEELRKDGSVFLAEVSAAFLWSDDGKPAGIIGMTRDITERKRAEGALRESEERYRLLAENATDVIWTFDMNLKPTYISPSVKQFRGYTVEEAMAQKLPEICTPESLAVVGQVFAEEMAIENREQKDLDRSRTLELEYKCKDGSTIWSEVKVSFIRDSSGRAVGILGVDRNITKRKQVEKEKADLQQQLQQAQKMEAIGRLAGGIAHDFNNLLTVIKGYCDLALMGLREEGPLRRAIEEINKAGDRAATLTHQLLAFSRRQILELKVVNLNDTLRNLNKMLQRLIGEDIELVMVLGEGLGKVKVDPGQIEQVVMNLAVNARDAMPMGGRLILETSNVEVGEEDTRRHMDLKVGSYVMLSVRDTGVGIAPEVKEYIFEPFFTTKERGKGTGLGLSMVYGIVNQSGGVIGVESELGRGTTFKIYFPRVVERVEGLEARSVKQEMPRGSETVLVVEDDRAVRDLASQILKRQGYRVLEASNGEEALSLYGVMKEPIHLVLTDVVMPRMSGRELVEHLISVYPEMRILYMSGYTDDAIVQHGVLEEGVSYIQKPFTMEGLAKKVREVLDKELTSTLH